MAGLESYLSQLPVPAAAPQRSSIPVANPAMLQFFQSEPPALVAAREINTQLQTLPPQARRAALPDLLTTSAQLYGIGESDIADALGQAAQAAMAPSTVNGLRTEMGDYSAPVPPSMVAPSTVNGLRTEMGDYSAPVPPSMVAPSTVNGLRTEMGDYSAPVPPSMVGPRPAGAGPTLVPIAQGAPPPQDAVILPDDAMTPNDARTLVGDYDASPGMDEPTTPNGARTMAGDYGGIGQTPGAAAPSPVQGLIDSLLKSSEVSDEDKWLALARGGFGAAASGSPTFFGAIGAGGNAGLSAYEEARKRALASKAQAAGLTLSEIGRVEQERSNKERERLSGRQIDETALSRRDALAARIEDAKARSEDQRLSITERAEARRDAAQLQVQLGQIAAEARVEAANRGFSQAVPGKGRDADGNVVDGAWSTNLNTGKMTFEPGAILNPRGRAGSADPSRIREAKSLVENGVAPNFQIAYAMVRAGVNDSAKFIQQVTAEKKTVQAQLGSIKMSDKDLEQMAIDNIIARAAARPSAVPGAPVAPAAAAPSAAPTARPPLSAFEKP
jgi:ribosomal protein L12E/L44/L45/RPP1/RPP2